MPYFSCQQDSCGFFLVFRWSKMLPVLCLSRPLVWLELDVLLAILPRKESSQRLCHPDCLSPQQMSVASGFKLAALSRERLAAAEMSTLQALAGALCLFSKGQFNQALNAGSWGGRACSWGLGLGTPCCPMHRAHSLCAGGGTN